MTERTSSQSMAGVFENHLRSMVKTILAIAKSQDLITVAG
jgi:hypothetical protein